MHIGYWNGQRRKRIALLGGVLISAVVAVFLLTKHSSVPELPKTILQLHMMEKVQGEKAKEMMNELHHKEVAPEINVIGKYQSGSGSGTLYLSIYPSHDSANDQLEKMAQRIRENNGVFSHFRETNVLGIKVFLCLGLGQAHYFFVGDDTLYWFAVDIPLAQASMQELIRLIASGKKSV
jgi:hypothetical protein